ncbi:MAG: alkaline phosphatase family protein [Alphaproteobacteria bacterium]|nr:alkaline phosphatase family protein [Alphaproteobacteria bacterium]
MSPPSDRSGLTRRDALVLGAVALPVLQLGCAGTPAEEDFDVDAIPESRTIFPRTVLAGDMQTDRVVLTMFFADGRPKTLRVWAEDAPELLVVDREVTPDAEGFVKERVTGLQPDTVYAYAWLAGTAPDFSARSLVGRVRTLPAPGSAVPVTVVFGACVGQGTIVPDFVDPGQTEPFTWALYDAAAALDWDVFVHLGDQGYFDRIWHDGGAYEAYLEAWGAYHGGSYRSVFPKAGLLATWDDHEVTDNSAVDPWTTEPSELERMANGKRAWFTVVPIDADDPTSAVWRSFRWGDTVELVLLDCRYEKTEGEPPHLVSEAQLAWLLERLTTSPCRFVCVCSPKPFATVMLQDGRYPGEKERWSGNPADRDRVVQAIDDGQLDHVLWVTGDIHMTYLGRLEETGDRVSDRMWEVCTTSGNVSPFADDLSTTQFAFGAAAPMLPRITFDAQAGTATVRFHDATGAVAHEQVIPLGA